MEVVGKYGIRAKVLKKSKSSVTGIVFMTFEVEAPRIILAEENTHRMLSKNSASSRAIPFTKMVEQLKGRPVRFGQANPGMQDKGEDFESYVNIPRHLWPAFSEYLKLSRPYITINDVLNGDPEDSDTQLLLYPVMTWEFARHLNIEMSKGFFEAGYAKQVYNRLTEPFQMMKTIISGTEWANFFWLRNHEAADPTLQELARVMYEADKGTEVEILHPGEWHLPYLQTMFSKEFGQRVYFDAVTRDDGFNGIELYGLEDAIKISCARCAAASFRNVDYDLEKSLKVYERLVGDERKHASAFEHCATPMLEGQFELFGAGLVVNNPSFPATWEKGVSHTDRDGNLWSGNLKGWRQYRKLIPGENYVGEY